LGPGLPLPLPGRDGLSNLMTNPHLNVCLAGGYWLHSYKRVLRDLRPLFDLLESGSPAVVTVDMSRLTFMGPAALATTVALLMKVRDSGLTLGGGTIQAPRAPGMFRYLHRMDFFRLLFHDPGMPDPSTRSQAEGLLECQHFVDDDDLRPVTKAILDAIASKTELDDQAYYALDTCLSELLENVIFHADAAPHGGVAAVQAFKNELEVAIVDLGVGIPTSLAKNPDYAELAQRDDLTAVQTALEPNVTSTPWRNRGWGLAFTELLLGLNEGHMTIRSEAGYVLRGSKNADKLVPDQPLPGTLVAMRIKTDQPLDYSKAWAMLDAEIGSVEDDDDDGGGDLREAG